MYNISSSPGNRVILWTNPRSTSTAFTRCIGQIPETDVWIQPFSYAYLAALNMKLKEGVDIPSLYEGNEELYKMAANLIGSVMDLPFTPHRLSYAYTKRTLEGAKEKNVFVKDLGIGIRDEKFREYIPSGYQHAFLIRHPFLTFLSLRKANFRQLRCVGIISSEQSDLTFDCRDYPELGEPWEYFPKLHALWTYVRESIDPNPIVIDSSDLLAKPVPMMTKFCEKVGLPYTESVVNWQMNGAASVTSWKWPGNFVGNEIYTGTAFSSTRLLSPAEPLSRDYLPRDVIALSDNAMQYYQDMYNHRLIITAT